ncbi:unnamed protein product [Brachionus calyciflorus]|uniref:Uncharacterized protein n=1 Tax=Brachionus calyciflorus TaxID=104777 RepID=A0A814S2R8_9BILA|nr:unnamed protein product [Brachionus calyciflorus]
MKISALLFLMAIYCRFLTNNGEEIQNHYVKLKNLKISDQSYSNNLLHTVKTKNKFLCMKACNDFENCETVHLNNNECRLIGKTDFFELTEDETNPYLMYSKKSNMQNIHKKITFLCDEHDLNRKYGESCKTDCSNQCNKELNLDCIDNLCKCENGFYYDNLTNLCVKFRLYGQECSDESKCDYSKFLECSVDKTCDCSANFFRVDETCTKDILESVQKKETNL